jgi:hypothetical protein
MACSVAAGAPSLALCRARLAALRPAEAYTPRVLPSAAGVSIPLELPLVHWTR